MRKRISHAQAALPFSGTRTRTLIQPYARERHALIVLGSLVMLAVVVYGTCIAASVREIALRQDALTESRKISTDVATLEGSYLGHARGITEEYARSLGYVQGTQRTFVTVSEEQLSYASNAR